MNSRRPSSQYANDCGARVTGVAFVRARRDHISDKQTAKEFADMPTDKPESITDIALDQIAGGYQLDRVFVKSWSTSGDADDRPTEEIALNYTEVEWTY